MAERSPESNQVHAVEWTRSVQEKKLGGLCKFLRNDKCNLKNQGFLRFCVAQAISTASFLSEKAPQCRGLARTLSEREKHG